MMPAPLAPAPMPPAMPTERPGAPSAYFGPTGFAWLVRGRLGGLAQPGAVATFESDMEGLRRMGVTTLVTLTAEWAPPAERLGAWGLRSLYVPIPDMAPPSLEQATALGGEIEAALAADETVAFHCRAGRGRTGTLLATTLIWLRPDAPMAIAQVKSACSTWIESASQMTFLDRFAEARRLALADADLEIPSPELRAGEAPRRLTRRTPAGARPILPENGQRAARNNNQKEEQDMSLDKALSAAMQSIPECLASGYVDMDTGMLLGIQTIDSHPQEVLDTLAAATADLFQGSSVVVIENIFKTARGTKSDNHYFQEFLIFSENLIHVFMRTKRYPGHVCTFVCRKSANPGMVLTKARMSLDAVANAF